MFGVEISPFISETTQVTSMSWSRSSVEVGSFQRGHESFWNPAVFKEIKGRQHLGYRPLFRDADRLTFGVGLIGISLRAALCRRVMQTFIFSSR